MAEEGILHGSLPLKAQPESTDQFTIYDPVASRSKNVPGSKVGLINSDGQIEAPAFSTAEGYVVDVQAAAGTFTLLLSHGGKLLVYNSSDPCEIQIPTSVFYKGFSCRFVSIGEGPLQFDPSSGVTILTILPLNLETGFVESQQHVLASMAFVATDTAVLSAGIILPEDEEGPSGPS